MCSLVSSSAVNDRSPALTARREAGVHRCQPTVQHVGDARDVGLIDHGPLVCLRLRQLGAQLTLLGVRKDQRHQHAAPQTKLPSDADQIADMKSPAYESIGKL